MQSDFVFTSESVTRGHPDKLCDQISDAIVGRALRLDPFARIVAECAVSTGIVFLSVKQRARGAVNVTEAAREVIREVGYVENRFRADTCTVLTSLHDLPEPRHPVFDESLTDDSVIDRLAVEDQANVFGFACTHTPSLMPLPIQLAHDLARRLDAARTGELDYLSPDGKTQVGIEFRGLRPHRVHSITLVAAQRASGVPSFASFQQDLLESVVRPTFLERDIRPDDQTRIAINPEGPIVGGGPELHAGLTGRKTAVDTYGEFARHSGAALSGKDPLRIDRVGAYAARYAAKNVVAAGLADQCEVQLTYAIGIAEPVSVNVETYGTGRIEENEIARRLRGEFDFRLGAIVRDFELRRRAHEDPDFFRRLAAYGHFGRTELVLPWERTDRIDALSG